MALTTPAPSTPPGPATPPAASRPAAGYALAGLAPATVERPVTPEAVADALRRAGDGGQAVVPWGAGTKQRFGNPPRAYDVAVDLTALDQVLEYEPADLVVTAQAGMPLAALQRRLAQEGQFLALDPPFGAQATLGGTLATNASGPSRLLYGTARDLVIGLRVATPEGELVRSGGKVVKNVVGYDLNKLHVGGLGTAGVIVEVTFKVHPLPAAGATVSAAFSSLEAAHAVAGRVVRSALFPRAADLVRGLDGDAGWRLLVWCAGSPAAVERQARDVREWCAPAGATEVARLDGEAHDALWLRLIEFGRTAPGAATQAGALLKLTCLPAQAAALLAAVDRAAGAPAALVRSGNGVAYVALAQADAALVRRVASGAHELGGSAVLEDGPDDLKRALDAWDPAGLAAAQRDDYALMRAIKAQFDPRSTLNPGRFVAGI
jgi:glycolate oxidase FAD binding subunit